MFTKEDRKTFGILAELATKRYDEDNAWLAKKCDELFDRASKAEVECMSLRTKVELYEKFIAKMLESDPDKSNDVFMLDGEIYRLAGYEIQSEPGKQKTLTAKFRCASDITHLFKNDVKTE